MDVARWFYKWVGGWIGQILELQHVIYIFVAYSFNNNDNKNAKL